MLEHRWEKLSKKACEHADESMFPVGGFPVFCLLRSAQRLLPAPSLQTPARHLASTCSLTEIPWPQHQMQVPGCAGGCCFRFLSAPNFSLYSIGRCWEMSTRALATARPWENPQREHMLRSSLLVFSKINLKILFIFPQYTKQSNKECREVLLHSAPSSTCPLASWETVLISLHIFFQGLVIQIQIHILCPSLVIQKGIACFSDQSSQVLCVVVGAFSMIADIL